MGDEDADDGGIDATLGRNSRRGDNDDENETDHRFQSRGQEPARRSVRDRLMQKPSFLPERKKPSPSTTHARRGVLFRRRCSVRSTTDRSGTPSRTVCEPRPCQNTGTSGTFHASNERLSEFPLRLGPSRGIREGAGESKLVFETTRFRNSFRRATRRACCLFGTIREQRPCSTQCGAMQPNTMIRYRAAMGSRSFAVREIHTHTHTCVCVCIHRCIQNGMR